MPSAFFSDPHFGHTNIIKYTNRPFKDSDEMDGILVERYNATISPTDVVLWLGDVFLCPLPRIKSIMARLNGVKLLVRGNHDRGPKTMVQLGFNLVMRECTTFIAGRICRINHYPYAGSEGKGLKIDDRYTDRRPEKRKGEILIHGHTHSHRRIFENMIHVGVDAWGYRPVLYNEVECLIKENFGTVN